MLFQLSILLLRIKGQSTCIFGGINSLTSTGVEPVKNPTSGGGSNFNKLSIFIGRQFAILHLTMQQLEFRSEFFVLRSVGVWRSLDSPSRQTGGIPPCTRISFIKAGLPLKGWALYPGSTLATPVQTSPTPTSCSCVWLPPPPPRRVVELLAPDPPPPRSLTVTRSRAPSGGVISLQIGTMICQNSPQSIAHFRYDIAKLMVENWAFLSVVIFHFVLKKKWNNFKGKPVRHGPLIPDKTDSSVGGSRVGALGGGGLSPRLRETLIPSPPPRNFVPHV